MWGAIVTGDLDVAGPTEVDFFDCCYCRFDGIRFRGAVTCSVTFDAAAEFGAGVFHGAVARLRTVSART